MNPRDIQEHRRVELLRPPTGRVEMVLDTDAFNEIDDQFAIAYALLSKENMDVRAVYAAPFHNGNSDGPEDGMVKSYDEIMKVLDLVGRPSDGVAFRGSRSWMAGAESPVESDAAHDLIRRAKQERDGPLYVVAIGAITNVASALLLAPEITDRIVLVWLGGQPFHWQHASDFNLKQDLHAARVVLDCGVPLVLVPCMTVMTHLTTTLAEVEANVKGRGRIGDYLYGIYEGCYEDHFARTRVIWDVAGIAYLVDNGWVPTRLVPSPILTERVTWSQDGGRHLIRMAYHTHRDPIFRDLFTKLARHSDQGVHTDEREQEVQCVSD